MNLENDYTSRNISQKLPNQIQPASLEPSPLPPLSPENGGMSIMPTALHPGDILLSTTAHFSSQIIRSATDLPISHARIVYSTQNANNPSFVEAVYPHVRIISYQEMMKDDTLCVAVRYPNLSVYHQSMINAWLLTSLGKDYDLGGVLEEWLSLTFQWMNNFRSIALGHPSKFYCSELVAEAFKAAGIDLLAYQGNPPNRNSAPGRFVQLLWFKQLNYVGHLKY